MSVSHGLALLALGVDVVCDVSCFDASAEDGQGNLSWLMSHLNWHLYSRLQSSRSTI